MLSQVSHRVRARVRERTTVRIRRSYSYAYSYSYSILERHPCGRAPCLDGPGRSPVEDGHTTPGAHREVGLACLFATLYIPRMLRPRAFLRLTGSIG